ncbi:cyanophycinase [Pseudoduganella sp. DS3]|uniref:Cyanophycinase n=1 Tax=Pseudoduganella guangdongensis TaxID=2692179 RepID=A0A6N9HKB6_9BURK|nr:cyanophycinase [Pseudoduganella guangdongensis]
MKFVSILLLSALGCAAQAGESAPSLTFQPVAGTVIPMGGAVRNDNEAVRQRLVQLAGGSAARFVVIPTASANPQKSGSDAVEQLRRRGAKAELLKIAPRWPGETLDSARKAAADPANVAKIAAATGVFFTGGAQEYTADVLNPDGVAAPVLQAVRALQARGGVVAGSSAGAAIMSSTMFRDAMNSVQVMKGVMRDGKEIDRGLGFVGDQLFIDQHFLKRGRVGRMLALMLAKGYKVGLGVDENTAAIIHGTEIEIVGASGALLLDLRQATQETGPMNVRNVRISYLDHGDRYDLAKLQGRVVAAKQAYGELKFRQPGFVPDLEFVRPAFTDILGENAILRALTQLVDGPRDHVRGIAFDLEQLPDAPVADPAPELGFEFMLRRDERTRGWDSAGLDDHDYSIFDARLDVRPVRLKTPFYQAW